MALGGYLAAEINGLKTPLTRFSARHPEAIVDLAWDNPTTAKPTQRMICLAKNLPEGAIAEAIRELEVVYGHVETLQKDEAAGFWLGRFIVDSSKIPDPRVSTVLRFMERYELRSSWIRLQDGTSFLRTEVPKGMDADRLADEFQALVSAAGLDVQVSIETAHAVEYPSLPEIVERLASGRPWKPTS